MNDRLDEFLELSVALTGFGRSQLMGTGVGAEYLKTVEDIVPDVSVARLFDAARKLSPCDEQAVESLVTDRTLGPIVKNIILMWYCGTWNPLPKDWCEVHGRSSKDVGHVVSSAAYLAGLQWATVSAHPPGGLPGGFGSWAFPPQEVQP